MVFNALKVCHVPPRPLSSPHVPLFGNAPSRKGNVSLARPPEFPPFWERGETSPTRPQVPEARGSEETRPLGGGANPRGTL